MYANRDVCKSLCMQIVMYANRVYANRGRPLGFTMCYSGLLTVICVSWVLIVLICGHKWKSVTHRCTIALALSQLSVGIGGYLCQYIDSTDSLQRYYLTYHFQYMFAVFGILSSRIWTAMLSITLALMHWKSLCFVRVPYDSLTIQKV